MLLDFYSKKLKVFGYYGFKAFTKVACNNLFKELCRVLAPITFHPLRGLFYNFIRGKFKELFFKIRNFSNE